MRTFQVPLTNKGCIVGRKREFCDVLIDYDKSVSGKHCQITTKNGKFYIADLQSSNGTYVNNNKIISEIEISSGTVIRLGNLQLRFEVR